LAQPVIPTAQYDNSRSGTNLQETILKPANVNSTRFGKLFVLPVEGDVYAQPLFIPKLEIPGKGVHDVVFIATEHDSVYAFDAAGQPTTPLWQVGFLDPKSAVTTVPQGAVNCPFIAPEIGITSTPVIDPATRTMYVLVRTREQDHFYQRLHALDISNGAEKPGSPVLIRASVKTPAWMGLTSTEVTFNALLENPRAALLLVNGTVYLSWASSCDVGPYYGWVLAYDARTLKQVGVFNTAPDSGESGIWQADAGMAADRSGNIFAVTGNGKFNVATGGRDYGDTVLKLGLQGSTVAVRDYFTPSNERALNSNDDDLGSSGPVLLPDQTGAHPHVLVAAGKAGVIYVVDRDRMGKFQAGSDSHAIQTLKGGVGSSAFGAPAYWNGHLFYFGSEDVLKDFKVDAGRLSSAPVHQGSYTFKDPGAIPVVSSNGASNGIVWIVLTKGWRDPDRYAILQAYDAADVSRLLYSTENSARDSLGLALRFSMPTVANGRVYVGTKHALYVYGLLTVEKKHR